MDVLAHARSTTISLLDTLPPPSSADADIARAECKKLRATLDDERELRKVERLALMRLATERATRVDELTAEIRELRDPEPVFAAERRKNAALEAKLREAASLEAKLREGAAAATKRAVRYEEQLAEFADAAGRNDFSHLFARQAAWEETDRAARARLLEQISELEVEVNEGRDFRRDDKEKALQFSQLADREREQNQLRTRQLAEAEARLREAEAQARRRRRAGGGGGGGRRGARQGGATGGGGAAGVRARGGGGRGAPRDGRGAVQGAARLAAHGLWKGDHRGAGVFDRLQLRGAEHVARQKGTAKLHHGSSARPTAVRRTGSTPGRRRAWGGRRRRRARRLRRLCVARAPPPPPPPRPASAAPAAMRRAAPPPRSRRRRWRSRRASSRRRRTSTR